MDDFFKEENLLILKKWVYFQVKNHPDLKIEEYDSRTYKIYYQDKVARFVIWPIGIVEEAIFQGNDLLFYLHYQFYNFYFAKDLFQRMLNKLLETPQEMKKILLCCSGGMTTGYFAQRLNQCCRLNHLPYIFNASPEYHLLEVYKNYDLILLAPQLRYMIGEIMLKVKPVDVFNIDAKTFATYNCQELLKVVEGYFGEKEEKNE